MEELLLQVFENSIYISSFLISAVSSFGLIKFAHKYKLFQPDREEIIAITNTKKFVPTMGGLAIFLALNLSMFFIKTDVDVILLGNSYALLGFCDDFLKLKRNKYSGLLVKVRVCFEILFAIIFVFYVILHDPTRNYVPFINAVFPFVLLWGMLVIISAANSFNLTDGIDTLASTLGIYTLLFIYFATYSNSSILFIACILGYLMFNVPPAKIIMGDTGALGIGAIIGGLFYKYHLELFLPFVGMVFVAQTVSVIIQIYYIRVLKKRLFLMAPIHHHFEKKGWSKGKILIVFNLVGILLLVVCLLFRGF